MVMWAWFLLAMIILAVLQTGKLIYQKHWGELVVFGVLWIAATGYASLIILGVHIPSPLQVIEFTLSRIYDFVGVEFPSH